MMLLDLDHLFSEGTLRSLPEGWDEKLALASTVAYGEVVSLPVLDHVEG
jgi:hypothetical protein